MCVEVVLMLPWWVHLALALGSSSLIITITTEKKESEVRALEEIATDNVPSVRRNIKY